MVWSGWSEVEPPYKFARGLATVLNVLFLGIDFSHSITWNFKLIELSRLMCSRNSFSNTVVHVSASAKRLLL